MSRNLRGRIMRLLQDTDPGECDVFTFVQRYRYGEPVPPIPPDAPRCSRCDKPHPLFEVLISSRAEAEAFLAERAS